MKSKKGRFDRFIHSQYHRGIYTSVLIQSEVKQRKVERTESLGNSIGKLDHNLDLREMILPSGNNFLHAWLHFRYYERHVKPNVVLSHNPTNQRRLNKSC